MAIKFFLTITEVAFIALLLSSLSFRAASQTPRLTVEDGKVWVKEVEPEVLYTFSRYFNSQKDWASVFPVSVEENINGILVAGDYKVFHDAISFTPRFPFAGNVSYKAMFYSDQLAHNANEVYLPAMNSSTLELEFTVKTSQEPASSITAVYPTADRLPENLLKFHICFSMPMTIGEAYHRIKLLDDDGKEIEKPFLVLDQELWDDEMKTLTILFDPGRIKRGLRPNVEMKPALQQSNRYTLVIEKGWKDINGNSTNKTFVKAFTCTPADRTAPVVSAYRVVGPKFENAALVVDLQESFDYVLLTNAIKITDSRGNVVDGISYLKNNETVIEFVPKNPWSEMQYTIRFNPLLEDLAGNNFNRLFDEDLTSSKSTEQPSNLLSFEVSNFLR